MSRTSRDAYTNALTTWKHFVATTQAVLGVRTGEPSKCCVRGDNNEENHPRGPEE
ncbi:hypothetical protein FRC07_013979, partial [Ceratobasidium sp. 392]